MRHVDTRRWSKRIRMKERSAEADSLISIRRASSKPSTTCNVWQRSASFRSSEAGQRSTRGTRVSSARSLGVRERANTRQGGTVGPQPHTQYGHNLSDDGTLQRSDSSRWSPGRSDYVRQVALRTVRHHDDMIVSADEIALSEKEREESDQNKCPSCSTICISGVVFYRPWSSRWSAWPSTRITAPPSMMFISTACHGTPVSIWKWECDRLFLILLGETSAE